MNSDKKKLSAAWRRENDAARVALHGLWEASEVFTVVTSTTGYTTTGAVTETLPAVAGQTFALEQHVGQLNALMQQELVLEKVRRGLVRCGLDCPQGDHRSALDLVEDAERLLSAPSGTDTSPATLIALRGGIHRAISEALRRCKGQEEAKSWSAKILSIGKRCGKAVAPRDHFQRLADVADAKMNSLSEAKDRSMSRDEIILRYVDGLNYLLAFLDGLDEGQLRA